MPNKVKVPVQALEVIDATGQSVAPESGDEVDVVIKATLDGISGGIATISPMKYNDVPYEKDMTPQRKRKPMSQEEALEEEEKALMKEAMEMDRSSTGGTPRATVY